MKRVNLWGRDEYTKDGLTHRSNGPAIHSFDSETWAINNKVHRYYGPARTTPSVSAWWIHGNWINK